MTESIHFVVPGMHCAGCIAKVERALTKAPGVEYARANLSTRRVSVDYAPATTDRDRLLKALDAIGFDAAPFDPRLVASDEATREKELLRALGVSGFATANIMILSVAVWAGFGGDMAESTRALMHWVAGVIALPAVAYAGRPFFRSARGALARGQMNMDVPISLAVILAAGASVMETIRGGEHVYFDASVSLLFFLLIGRFLDQRMRGRASDAAQNLLNLRAVDAIVITAEGGRQTVPSRALEPGMRVLVASGMRLPADGRVLEGRSHIDAALITGETTPETVEPGSQVFAGTLNQGAPLTVEVTARDEDSLLAEIVSLMEAAEQGKGEYVRLADRLVRWYAPGVHILAALTFVGWMARRSGRHPALMAAIAVLIVTCPCALGLAVPVVQVVSSGRLLKKGTLVKSGDAFERLAAVDHVVFDKTGTITGGALTLADREAMDPNALVQAAALAAQSSHPLSQALVREAQGFETTHDVRDVEEHPGQGLSGRVGGRAARLGRRDWVLGAEALQAGSDDRDSIGPEIWFAIGDDQPVRFVFNDTPRSDAGATIARLQALGLTVELLSGDRPGAVAATADAVGIDQWRAAVSPADKIAHVTRLGEAGSKVLMVGDGLNDAPALAAAHASISPASASDVAQTTADIVFQGEALAPVAEALIMGRAAHRRVIENFGLALGYNAIAVPLAALGFVTPLIAAIAMSSSSILVTLNALRLRKAA